MGVMNRGSYAEVTRKYRTIAMHLRLPPREDAREGLRAWSEDFTHGTFLLEVIEATLEIGLAYDDDVSDFALIMDQGNSAYRVSKDYRSLEMRVANGVRASVMEAIISAPTAAGDHLTTAWNAAYGRTPDPVRSYSESIKAAEYALAPVISPTSTRTSLGTMIHNLTDKPEKWSFAIQAKGDSIDVVVAMMRSLWHGQSSRHGGETSRDESPEEARAAVHLSAALVQFGISGALRRADS